jgi:hypothetical protein
MDTILDSQVSLDLGDGVELVESIDSSLEIVITEDCDLGESVRSVPELCLIVSGVAMFGLAWSEYLASAARRQFELMASRSEATVMPRRSSAAGEPASTSVTTSSVTKPIPSSLTSS